MNITKLNPIGYNSQTRDGKTYKKSNIGKSAALAGMAGVEIFLSNSKYGKQFRLEHVLKNDLNINIPKKYSTPLNIFGIALDLTCAYGIGAWIDKQINNNRIKKADKT